jgi:WhiB family transcriptional regulator, redox-sensing transcriptional regulator
MTLAMREIDWTAQARCADQSSRLFYPLRTAHPVERDVALSCCNGAGGCPVRRHCLAYAIANTEREGIWGGLSARERNDLAHTHCPACRERLGRPLIADMVLDARQHARCPSCGHWCEVVPSWDRIHRNGHVV